MEVGDSELESILNDDVSLPSDQAEIDHEQFDQLFE